MRRGLAGAVVTTLVAVVVPALSAAAVAPPICQGRPATIVGNESGYVEGTSGDDVIVMPRAYLDFVVTEAGDDVVCLVDGPAGKEPDPNSLNSIDLGDGDDLLVNESTHVGLPILIEPGQGADTVLGGVEDEVVGDGDRDDTDRDVFHLGDGHDEIYSGYRGRSNADDIDLGPGNDSLTFAGPLASGGRIAGGDGTDTLSPGWYDPNTGIWVGSGQMALDNRLGVATLDGVPALTWTGFEDFDLDSARRTYSFVGGDGPETVTAGNTAIAVDLGGGDDILRPVLGTFYRQDAVFEGGAGQDRIEASGSHLRLDLRRSLDVRWNSSPERHHVSLRGFEDADVAADYKVWVRGISADQAIRAGTLGKLEVRGMGGADRIKLYGYNGAKSGTPRRRAWGGAGDDRLLGSGAADLLVGGPGRDVAGGRGGVDRCRAEVTYSCEARGPATEGGPS